MPWQAIQFVTSGLTLLAFVVTVFAWVSRRRLLSNERNIRAAPPEDRVAMAQSVADAFLISAERIDPNSLTREQRFELLMEQIRQKERRLYAILIATLIATGLAGLTAYASYVKSAATKLNPVESREKSSLVVKVIRGPGADDLATKLRNQGYQVNVISDDYGSNADDLRYRVLWYGRLVGPRELADVVVATRAHMPWVRYIFQQYRRHDWDAHIMVNSNDEWIDKLGLQPVTDEAFRQLATGDLSPDRLQALANTFKR
jgi:hypothetical protein